MHPIIVSVSRALAATCLLACASVAFAQAADQAPAADAPHRHGPSPKAFAACASKAANDTCSFTTQRGTITGQCAMPRVKPSADTSGAGGAGAASTTAAAGGADSSSAASTTAAKGGAGNSSAAGTTAAKGGAGNSSAAGTTAAKGGAGGTSAAGDSATSTQLVCRPDRAARHDHAQDKSGGN